MRTVGSADGTVGDAVDDSRIRQSIGDNHILRVAKALDNAFHHELVD